MGSRLTPPPGSADTLPMMWKMGSMGCSAFGWQASGSAVAAAASSAAAARAGAHLASLRDEGRAKENGGGGASSSELAGAYFV